MSGSIPSERLFADLWVQDKKVRGRWDGDLWKETNWISRGFGESESSSRQRRATVPSIRRTEGAN